MEKYINIKLGEQGELNFNTNLTPFELLGVLRFTEKHVWVRIEESSILKKETVNPQTDKEGKQ